MTQSVHGCLIPYPKTDEPEEKTKMTEMVVLAFDGTGTAATVKDKLVTLNNQYMLSLYETVEVVRESDGKVKIKEEPKLTRQGAIGGAFWGFLIGLIFLVPGLGMALGAAGGAIAGHFSKYGISREFMGEINMAIQPGQSALFIMAGDVDKADRVIPMLKDYHPRVLRTSLSAENENKLREAFGSTTPLVAAQ